MKGIHRVKENLVISLVGEVLQGWRDWRIMKWMVVGEEGLRDSLEGICETGWS